MPKKDPSSKVKEESPRVNPELTGLDVTINGFGEIIASVPLDKINAFLDKNVEDKKLLNRKTPVKKSKG